LINPWARSAGLHAMTVATSTGVEALHINPAGGARISSTEIALSHTRYFSAQTSISMPLASLRVLAKVVH